MTEEITINLPKLGESIHSGTVVRWFKKEGESVALDEPLLEVSTDKVNSEIPAPVAGVIKKILVDPDQEVQVGDPLLVMEKAGAAVEVATAPPVQKEMAATRGAGRGFFSPALLRLAREHGVSVEELEKIPGSGGEGRVTRKDFELFLEKRGAPAKVEDGVERIKITGMRKSIAENIVRSYKETPHAALVCVVDVTDVLKLVKENKAQFLQTHGAKLTVTSFVIHALAHAAKEFSHLNASVEGDDIVVKHFVNVGVAVSVVEGLMVPVIKGCEKKSVTDVALTLDDLTKRARAGKLLPDEVHHGTITFSNFGMSGMTMGLPIIRHPEVAILGMASIEKRVMVLDGDETAVRSMVNLSLSFDHRVVDGMYSCHFLAAVKENLERPPALV